MRRLKKTIICAAAAVLAASGVSVATTAPAQADPIYEYRSVYPGPWVWDCLNYQFPPRERVEIIWGCHYVLNVNGGTYAIDYRVLVGNTF